MPLFKSREGLWWTSHILQARGRSCLLLFTRTRRRVQAHILTVTSLSEVCYTVCVLARKWHTGVRTLQPGQGYSRGAVHTIGLLNHERHNSVWTIQAVLTVTSLSCSLTDGQGKTLILPPPDKGSTSLEKDDGRSIPTSRNSRFIKMGGTAPPLATLRWSTLQNVITDHHNLALTKIEHHHIVETLEFLNKVNAHLGIICGKVGWPTLTAGFTKIGDRRRHICPCSIELLRFPSNFAIPNFRLEPHVSEIVRMGPAACGEGSSDSISTLRSSISSQTLSLS